MLNRTGGPRNSVIWCRTDGWGTAIIKFKAWSARTVGSPDSCSKVDTNFKSVKLPMNDNSCELLVLTNHRHSNQSLGRQGIVGKLCRRFCAIHSCQ